MPPSPNFSSSRYSPSTPAASGWPLRERKCSGTLLRQHTRLLVCLLGQIQFLLLLDQLAVGHTTRPCLPPVEADVQQLDVAIAAARGQQLAVDAEGQAAHVRLGLQRLTQRPA